MCTVWGYAQGWWTVAGLVSDIFGFTLLAIDVGREYMRHRRAINLEAGAEAAEWLVRDNKRPSPEPIVEGANEVEQRVRASRSEIREQQRRLRHMLLRATEITEDPEGKISAIERLEEKIEAFRLKAASERAKPFKRAPIFTGILFVILGFVLQLVGAVPCS